MSEPVKLRYRVELELRADDERVSIVCTRCPAVVVSITVAMMEELKLSGPTLLQAAALTHQHEEPG